MTLANPPVAKALLKPTALKPKDRVALIAPASRPYKPSLVSKAVKLVEDLGFVPVVGRHVLEIKGHSAGTDEERLSDLNSSLADDSIAGIFCITGGFGALPLVRRMDFLSIVRRPKIIVGGDENTSILLAAYAECGLVSFHGANLDDVKTKAAFNSLKAAVTSKRSLPSISCAGKSWGERHLDAKYVAVAGSAEGRLVGGNLSALVSLFGTPVQPALEDAILFLTDSDERNDILDRWFTTLYVSQELSKVAAAVIGYFDDCGSKGSYNLLSHEDIFGERLKQLKIPSCFDFPIAGGVDCPTVPIGVNARFETAGPKLTFLESALL